MADQALLDAIDQAIAALENAKRLLVQERTAQETELPAQEAEEPSVTLPNGSSAPQRTHCMKTAADFAAAVCQQWTFRDDPGNVINPSLLRYSAEEQDSIGTVDRNDPANHYIVSPDGAIGLTEDDGESIDWLFLPLGRSAASLPKTLRKGELWPDAQSAPVPQLVPTSQPAPSALAAPTGSVCPGCGKPVSPGSKFCMGCGTQLSSAPAAAPAAPRSAFCIQCGAPMNPGDKFCMKCGAKAQ